MATTVTVIINDYDNDNLMFFYLRKVSNRSIDSKVHSDDRVQAFTNSLLEPPITKISFFAHSRGYTESGIRLPFFVNKSFRTLLNATCLQ